MPAYVAVSVTLGEHYPPPFALCIFTIKLYELLLIHQADIVILTTSEENGLCYIETAELDG